MCLITVDDPGEEVEGRPEVGGLQGAHARVAALSVAEEALLACSFSPHSSGLIALQGAGALAQHG